MALEQESRNDLKARQERISGHGFVRASHVGWNRPETVKTLQIPEGHYAVVRHSDGTEEEFGPNSTGHSLRGDSRLIEIRKEADRG